MPIWEYVNGGIGAFRYWRSRLRFTLIRGARTARAGKHAGHKYGWKLRHHIDILAVVPNSADETSYVPQLSAVGYSLRVREPSFFEHRMLRTAARDAHVHVFSPAAPEISRMITFRDRLRRSAEDRARYEAVKRRLAAQSWSDMNAYAEAKTGIIESIHGRCLCRGRGESIALTNRAQIRSSEAAQLRDEADGLRPPLIA
jgi:hypothetical protein